MNNAANLFTLSEKGENCMELTKNELQFMNVLWQSENPITAPEILERSTERTWKDRSLHVILNNLLDKGAIVEHGFIKEGRTISRTFVPKISREEYYKTVLADCGSKELLGLVSAIMRDRNDFEDETVDELEEIFRNWSEK
jgi:predicted transcriptional regulator